MASITTSEYVQLATRDTLTSSPASQLDELSKISSDHPSIPILREIVAELRDDELEHLDTAVSNFSQRAPAHALLSTIVGVGCKAAIEVCKRI